MCANRHMHTHTHTGPTVCDADDVMLACTYLPTHRCPIPLPYGANSQTWQQNKAVARTTHTHNQPSTHLRNTRSIARRCASSLRCEHLHAHMHLCPPTRPSICLLHPPTHPTRPARPPAPKHACVRACVYPLQRGGTSLPKTALPHGKGHGQWDNPTSHRHRTDPNPATLNRLQPNRPRPRNPNRPQPRNPNRPQPRNPNRPQPQAGVVWAQPY